MAADDKNAPASRNINTATARALQKQLTEAMNEKAWRDQGHARHLSAVNKVHEIYKKLHAASK